MKTDRTYIDRSQFEKIMTEEGLTWSQQSGFLKAEPVKGRRLYVAATKKVGRVDLAGFEVDTSLARRPEGGEFGQVKQQLLMTGSEEEVLARFLSIVRTLKSLSPAEKTKKVHGPKAPMFSGKSLEGAVPAKPQTILDRKDLILEYSLKTGIPVSPKTIQAWETGEVPVAPVPVQDERISFV